MDTLTEIKKKLENLDLESLSTDMVLVLAAILQVEAQQAQAEQLKRIGDMLEGYLATYCDPAVFGQDTDELAEARTDYADAMN